MRGGGAAGGPRAPCTAAAARRSRLPLQKLSPLALAAARQQALELGGGVSWGHKAGTQAAGRGRSAGASRRRLAASCACCASGSGAGCDRRCLGILAAQGQDAGRCRVTGQLSSRMRGQRSPRIRGTSSVVGPPPAALRHRTAPRGSGLTFPAGSRCPPAAPQVWQTAPAAWAAGVQRRRRPRQRCPADASPAAQQAHRARQRRGGR